MTRSLAIFAVALVGGALLASLSACPPEPAPPQDAGPEPLLPHASCPGQPGCATSDGPLLAGVAARKVTHAGFEIARASYLRNDRPDSCEPGLPRGVGETRCGELKGNRLDDCGSDAICPGDPDYEGPDADGSEGDGRRDYFWDCGRDRICPPPYDTPELGELATNGIDDDGDGAIDEGPWPGPDPDGSEGDGIFQGLWIAGYGNNRPAMGVKDDLWTRAVVLSTGETTVALVTVDVVGLFYDEVLRIRERVEAARPGAIDLVIVQATHTHEAPDTMGQWGLEDAYAGLQFGHGRDDAHMELIRQQSAEAVVAALDGLVEAELFVGKTNTRVDGFLHDGRDPQIFEDTLTVVELRAKQDGAVITTLVHWGNHPESLDSRNNFISSDYAHALREGVEKGLAATDLRPARDGRGGVTIYQQGLVGGIMGPNGFPITGRDGTVYENRYKTFARTDAYGENLAEQAFVALEEAELVESPLLRFSRRVFRAPVRNQAFHVGLFNGWFDRALYGFDEGLPIDDDNLPVLETEVALVYLGPIAWMTAPGEMFPETYVGFDVSQSFGLPQVRPDNANPPDLSKAPPPPYLRERLGVAFPMVLGLGLDEIGYLVPPYDFQLHASAPWIERAPGHHYEETNSIGPEAVPLVLENLGALIEFEAKRR